MSITSAAWVVLATGVLLIALLGSLAGWVTAVVLRGDQKGLLLDAALAVVGYLVVYERGEIVREPASYPDSWPWPWALIVACVLPVLHQIYRRRRQGPN
jgi:uncharacterized membrane protein YeaQ/YmgE (transglycosylase-associated protein family)